MIYCFHLDKIEYCFIFLFIFLKLTNFILNGIEKFCDDTRFYIIFKSIQ